VSDMIEGKMEDLIGKVVKEVEVIGDERIRMSFEDGTIAEWYHYQDCCESVTIEDVTGDWSDLYGHPLLVCEERTSDDFGEVYDHDLWTFYTFRSVGGSVDVRWYGTSNGYYSVSVDFQTHKAQAVSNAGG
jgi:hypothetical protein